MAKWDPLRDYLRNLALEGQKEITLSFRNIETINGFPLGKAAYDYRQFWENDRAITRSQSRAWLDAGWEVAEADLGAKKVRFQRIVQPDRGTIGTKTLSLFTVKCGYCRGTGIDPSPGNITGKDCRKCRGTGRRTLLGSEEDYITDEICEGTARDLRGFDPWEPCHICDGTGLVKKVR